MEPPLTNFYLYQTEAQTYVTATAAGGAWRVLKLSRRAAELEVTEDPTPYTKQQCSALLRQLHDGNLAHGGLQLMCQAYGIVGCFRLTQGHYMLLATQRRCVGAVAGHKVYAIEQTALLPLLSPAAQAELFPGKAEAATEARYRRLIAGVPLGPDFFYSHTYPLWRTAQRTFASEPPADWAEAFASSRVWNAHLTRPLREALGPGQRWALPVVHGFWAQRMLGLLGRQITLTLVARRSREFAGTRYLKRGISAQGHVANDVEVEQLLEAGVDWRTRRPLLSAAVQVRGSVPLFWSQAPEPGRLKPRILLQSFDPLYAATRLHFDDLRRRYGDRVWVLNLVKQGTAEHRQREAGLGAEFAAAVRYLNAHPATQPAVAEEPAQEGQPQQHRPQQAAQRGSAIRYAALDLHLLAKTAPERLLPELLAATAPALDDAGVFVLAGPHAGLQRGVLRTNCVDCLDRTNVAQFAYGLQAAGRQLHALGVSEGATLDPGSSLALQLMGLYERLGHSIALQYGGSEAHTPFFQRQRGDWQPAAQSRDVLTAIRRYYSNAVTDAEKQDSISLLLGDFVPVPEGPHIWELGGGGRLLRPGSAADGGAASPPPRLRSISAPGGLAGRPAAAAAAAQPVPCEPGAGAGQPAPESPPVPSGMSPGQTSLASSSYGDVPSLHQILVSAASTAAPEVQGGASRPQPQPTSSAAAGASTSGGTAPAKAAAAAESAPGVPGLGLPATTGPPAGLRRRSLLEGAGRRPKLASFDRMLSKDRHVSHTVQLEAAAAPEAPSGYWLSPSRPRPPAAVQRPAADGAVPALRIVRSSSDTAVSLRALAEEELPRRSSMDLRPTTEAPRQAAPPAHGVFSFAAALSPSLSAWSPAGSSDAAQGGAALCKQPSADTAPRWLPLLCRAARRQAASTPNLRAEQSAAAPATSPPARTSSRAARRVSFGSPLPLERVGSARLDARAALDSALAGAAEGLQRLGLPPSVAPLWGGSTDAVACMLQQEAEAGVEYRRQLDRLAQPPSPAQQALLAAQCTAAARPAWEAALAPHLPAPPASPDGAGLAF